MVTAEMRCHTSTNTWSHSFMVTFGEGDLKGALADSGVCALPRHLHPVLRLSLVDDVTIYTRGDFIGAMHVTHMMLHPGEVRLGRASLNMDRGVAW